eukprot:7164464-Alexandrium_andersonii.AAC.1
MCIRDSLWYLEPQRRIQSLPPRSAWPEPCLIVTSPWVVQARPRLKGRAVPQGFGMEIEITKEPLTDSI